MIGTIEDASLIRLENTGALTWRDPAVLGFPDGRVSAFPAAYSVRDRARVDGCDERIRRCALLRRAW
jgi:hypothetical protein